MVVTTESGAEAVPGKGERARLSRQGIRASHIASYLLLPNATRLHNRPRVVPVLEFYNLQEPEA